MSSVMCRETDGNLDVKCAIFTHKELITIFLLYLYKTVNCFLSFLFLFFWPINCPKKYNTERVSNSKSTTFFLFFLLLFLLTRYITTHIQACYFYNFHSTYIVYVLAFQSHDQLLKLIYIVSSYIINLLTDILLYTCVYRT